MDNKLYVDNLKDLTVKQISSGQNGKCYLTKDNMVFKFIENPDEENLIRLSKFYSSHFIFPRVLVYSNEGKLLGYIMEYADGNTLSNLPAFVSFEKYNNEVERVEREIEVLTCYRLRLLDMGRNNMIYSEKDGLKVIDTDFYVPKNKSKTLYLSNMKSFAYGVMSPMLDISNTNFENSKLNKYSYLTIEGRMKPSDYIFELKNELKKNGFEEAESIGRFSNQLKLLRK